MTPNNPKGFNRVIQWLQRRQRQVLEQAYADAEQIRNLENQYYGGEPIRYYLGQNKTVFDYVRNLRDRKLLQIRTNLTQFGLISFTLNQSLKMTAETDSVNKTQEQAALEQLNFIESVIGKYRESPEDELAQAAALMEEQEHQQGRGNTSTQSTENQVEEVNDPAMSEAKNDPRELRRRGLLGGGLLGRKLDPNYEKRVVLQLRLERKQNQVALRWLVILIVIPLLLGLVSRHFLFEPLLGNYAERNPEKIELNEEIQENFAAKLSHYREELEVKELLELIPEMSPQEKRDRIADQATELWREAREEELTGLKNLLADLVTVGVFAGLIYFNRSRLKILRSATNRTFLSLSDPVKVFAFILFTDIFVGFHSAEGWSVILNSLGHHFGLPENETAVGLFIATVPVFLDSCIKFWIFNYLTRFSPASSAVYERMNT